MGNRNRNMPVLPGTMWKCIDKYSDYFGKTCVIISMEDNPDYNGDGTMELLYDGNETCYTKCRRLVPGITHEFIRFT